MHEAPRPSVEDVRGAEFAASAANKRCKYIKNTGASMNKADLVEVVAEAADLSRASAARAVDAVTDAIVAALKKNEAVTLSGFGTFVVRERAARVGRNPRTGEAINIGASRALGFKPGKALKDALN
jgi:DNA-binding protein HU-beta